MGRLRQLLIEQLQRLLDVEAQLTKAIPLMAEAAEDPRLKAAFQGHLAQTEGR